MSQIGNNINIINSKLKKGVELVAVSKYRTKEEIIEACEAGQRVFGENRVQEALTKWPEIKEKYPDVKLHLIGPLQTNKIKDALKIFDVIEVIDRKKLALKINYEMANIDRPTEFYIQVNTGDESQKSGVAKDEADERIEFCRSSGLNIVGLMCIPPVDENPEPHFKFLKAMAKKHNLPFLSMGMSSDFEIAIACGATHVRVGTAIFGARE